MKCIKFTDGKIVRVANELAERLVGNQEAAYVDRKTWREAVRDKDKVKKD